MVLSTGVSCRSSCGNQGARATGMWVEIGGGTGRNGRGVNATGWNS
jgi:hypothetical protein